MKAELPRINVRLGVTVEFGTTVLVRKMGPLLRAHPELHVDYFFSNDLVTPLLRDELDLVVDCQQHHHPSVVSIALFRETYVVVASEELLTSCPIECPKDLEEATVLSLDKEGDWWGNLMQALSSEKRPVFRDIVEVNHIRGIINAALDGQGVGFVPKYTVLSELSEGRLRRLFPDLNFLEDCFSIIQKLSRSRRAKNELVTNYLLGLDASEFGDAIQSIED